MADHTHVTMQNGRCVICQEIVPRPKRAVAA